MRREAAAAAIDGQATVTGLLTLRTEAGRGKSTTPTVWTVLLRIGHGAAHTFRKTAEAVSAARCLVVSTL